jgi:hypothetical protein
MSFRAVRSPLAPKITIEHGSTGLRASPKRQISGSSATADRSTRATMGEGRRKYNGRVRSGSQANATGQHGENEVGFGPIWSGLVFHRPDYADIGAQVDQQQSIFQSPFPHNR